MSCHRWGTNRTPWLIGQFKRKMAKKENYISRERPLHQRHGDARVVLSSCYGNSFPYKTCFLELFYLENFVLSLTNGVWKVRVQISLASVQFTKIGKAPPKNKIDCLLLPLQIALPTLKILPQACLGLGSLVLCSLCFFLNKYLAISKH